MKFIADLHFHSKYSRAVSPQMELENINFWGKKKGIDILTTTDFTHPVWFREIKIKLKETETGVYKLINSPFSRHFILTTEVSLMCEGHRIHLVVFAPNIKTVEKINQRLTKQGFNLISDGRPILGISAHDCVALLKEVDSRITIVPAHVWTPWFSLYGSRSGYNSIDECFGEYSKEIAAIETGHSSDPLMNWQIKELDNRIIISSSDGHSPKNISREATIFELPKNFTYDNLVSAFKTPYLNNHSDSFVSCTIEFYPEEGKYHYTGHRKCGVCQSPEDSKRIGAICPVCGKMLTVGVMHRVQELSRKKRVEPVIKFIDGVRTLYHPQNIHHPFICLVPLSEIIAEAEGLGVQTKGVQEKYKLAVESLGSEIEVLVKKPIKEIAHMLGERIAEGIDKNRRGKIHIDPGYDGVYGKVKIWGEKNPILINNQHCFEF